MSSQLVILRDETLGAPLAPCRAHPPISHLPLVMYTSCAAFWDFRLCLPTLKAAQRINESQAP